MDGGEAAVVADVKGGVVTEGKDEADGLCSEVACRVD